MEIELVKKRPIRPKLTRRGTITVSNRSSCPGQEGTGLPTYQERFILEVCAVSSEKAPDMNRGHGSTRLPQFSTRGIYSLTLALLGGMLLANSTIFAQGVFLKAGDSYSFKFNSLPFSHLENM